MALAGKTALLTMEIDTTSFGTGTVNGAEFALNHFVLGVVNKAIVIDNCRSDGFDFAVELSTDLGVALKMQIVYWNEGDEEFEVWFKMGATDDLYDVVQTFTLYGNEPLATNPNTTDVWDSDYKTVLQMDDLTTSTIEEFTSNTRTWTKHDVNEPNEIEFFTRRVQDFDGVDDTIVTASDADLHFANGDLITVRALVNPDGVGGGNFTIVTDRESNFCSFALRHNAQSIQFYYRNSANNLWHVWGSANVLTAFTWADITVTYTYGTGSSIKVYLDGVDITSGGFGWVSGTGNDAPYASTETIKIGHVGDTPAELFNGKMALIQVSKGVIHTPEKIELQHELELFYLTYFSFEKIGHPHFYRIGFNKQ